MVHPVRTILIVDDSPEDRELYRRCLQRDRECSYTILEASLGQQGLALCQQHHPDAVLLDYRLPDLDGLEFLTQLQSLLHQPRLPVIVVTGQGSEAIAVQAMKAGAQDYLVKEHISTETLRVALNSAITNVTLRQQLQRSEASLQQSEERYRTLFESMETGFCVVQVFFDPDNTPIDYRLLEVNPAFEAQTGLQQAEGKTARQLVPNLETYWFEAYGKVALTGQSVRFEHNSETMNRWFEVHAFPVGTPEQHKVAILFKDISDRKRTEESLRQSEAFKRRMLESSSDCIKLLDLNGRLLYMNTGGLCLLEIDDVSPYLNADWFCFWQENDRKAAKTALTAARAGEMSQFQGFCPTAKGTPKWWDVVMTPILDPDGQVIEILATSRDITARKQAEAALQEHTQHNRLLYEITRDLLSTNHPLHLVEKVFAELKGLIGLDVYFNYILDESQQRLRLRFYGGISNQIAQQMEWLELGQAVCGTVAQQRCQIMQTDVQDCTDTETRLARSLGLNSYCCHPLIAQDRLFGTLSFGSRSRTEFTSSEQALFQAICNQLAIALERTELLSSLQRQTEELIRVNRIKDEFLAILSHELRSPLNPILGWTKLMQSRKFSPAKTAEALATIERNAKLQCQLIDDLLDVAKILQGKLSMEVAPVDLAFVIEAAIDTVKAAAVAKNILLQPLLPQIGQVSGDATRLQQIVWNLLSNAIKFTPVGGRVDIQLSSGSESSDTKSSDTESSGSELPLEHQSQLLYAQDYYPKKEQMRYAQITVRDTGKGINPDFLPYIFESFRQEDASTTRSYGGLGLGLAIVRHLVEAHGGTIWADSQGEGQGATFTLQLPLLSTKTEPSQLEDVTWQESDLTGIRILTVDDEPDARELLTAILTQYGANVLAVDSAAAALANLALFQPDVLVSDIGMPEVDGYSLIQQIRALPPEQGGRVAAMALTAYAREEEQQRAITSGYQWQINKPIDPEQLVQAVMSLLQKGNFTMNVVP